jgi:hypothetical protein
MIVVLLPTTNIYLPHSSHIENTKKIQSLPPFLLSQSMSYYLNNVNKKTENVDYSYFKNIYNANSNIVALSQSFYIFVELFQHFDIQFEAHNIGYFVKGDCVDWGIVQSLVPYYKFVGMDNSNHGMATTNIYINIPSNIEIPINLQTAAPTPAFPRFFELGAVSGGRTLSGFSLENPELSAGAQMACGLKVNPQFANMDIDNGVNIITTTGNDNMQTDITIMDYLPSSFPSLDFINTQKIGSTLILKIGNCFETGITQLLYYLCSVYNKVFVAKPVSCWGGESTKYVVCKSFTRGNISSLASIKPTHIFLTKIEELNCIFCEEQIETLLLAFNKPEKLNTIMKSYQQRCVNWFLKHNLPING